MDFVHIPIMVEAILQELIWDKHGFYVDGTLGSGGHTEAILRAYPKVRLLGIDQDPQAIAAAQTRLQQYADRVTISQGNFRNLSQILAEQNQKTVNGILLDIGVSSPQLDQAQRGFSYQHDGDLDMRMDTSSGLTAYDLVNEWSAQALEKILTNYGEERWAHRIAEFIVRRRQQIPIRRTSELVQIVKAAVPAAARQQGKHPAKRTFQAIRIAVNDELAALEAGLQQGVQCLKIKGRFAVITFHSLEDRIVKNTFRDLSRGCICPPRLPVCTCDRQPIVQLRNRKPIVPSQQEQETNARCKSAKLRIVEKC